MGLIGFQIRIFAYFSPFWDELPAVSNDIGVDLLYNEIKFPAYDILI